MAPNVPLPVNDPSALKKLEKQVIKEGKTEDSNVSHAMKDYAHLEKDISKATKAVDKSEHALQKTQKKEMSAKKALNKAAHQHDVAAADVTNAQKNLNTKQERDTRLHQELEAKKTYVEQIVAQQQTHNQARDARLEEIQQAKSGGVEQTGPATNAPPTV